jgi:hypothetical protein
MEPVGCHQDRVSLYGRAVDVLLDTWNIKGHDPLNAKEAVPQLAYVAFQLMCMGKQTATEKELLILLEEAREKHPSIKRYAKDSPHEFLKRVELRSSLLLEAGHQMEGRRTVPFYQFRHLTFQEYLTAVAVTEGHYQQYRQDDTVLTPLAGYLLAEEWKEVIPMVAVLARKRAEPLLVELISIGNRLRAAVEAGDVNEEQGASVEKNYLVLPGAYFMFYRGGRSFATNDFCRSAAHCNFLGMAAILLTIGRRFVVGRMARSYITKRGNFSYQSSGQRSLG